MHTPMWTHTGSSALLAFVASAVEAVEALTVVLAVGTVRGWRATLLGAAAALGVLLLIVAVGGPAITSVPLSALQLIVGILLVLFGLRWLQKAMLRAAGVIPIRDETAAFARQVARAQGRGSSVERWDRFAFGTSFQIVMVEGIEVVFIVVAVSAGGTGLLLSTSEGAAAAVLLVAAIGVVAHRPLSRVPENALKFTVGVVLSAFGTFLSGEGMGLRWPEGDWSILALVAGYLFVAAPTIRICRTLNWSSIASRDVRTANR